MITKTKHRLLKLGDTIAAFCFLWVLSPWYPATLPIDNKTIILLGMVWFGISITLTLLWFLFGLLLKATGSITSLDE